MGCRQPWRGPLNNVLLLTRIGHRGDCSQERGAIENLQRGKWRMDGLLWRDRDCLFTIDYGVGGTALILGLECYLETIL